MSAAAYDNDISNLIRKNASNRNRLRSDFKQHFIVRKCFDSLDTLIA